MTHRQLQHDQNVIGPSLTCEIDRKHHHPAAFLIKWNVSEMLSFLCIKSSDAFIEGVYPYRLSFLLIMEQNNSALEESSNANATTQTP